MAAFAPVYKLVIYAPRREDPTEATVLTPIGGAVHSDPFQVATKRGISGFKGYLGLPRGRRGKIDFLSRKVDIGELTLPLLDKRTTAGGTNLERWVSAFIGDAKGRNRLPGCKAVVWESLDGGSSWSAFFTGRVVQYPVKDALWYELTIRDMAMDLDIDVFTGLPHASVTYAAMAPLLPNGAVLQYANFSTSAELEGTVKSQGSATAGLRIVELTNVRASTGVENYVTRRVWDADHVPPIPSPNYGSQVHPTATVRLTRLDTMATGVFRLRFMGGRIDLDDIGTVVQAADDPDRRYFDRVDHGRHWRVSKVGVEQLGALEPGYMAMPPNGTAVKIHVLDDSAPKENSPLLISDVHPAQFMADLLDGYFGRLNTDGTPRLPVVRDTAAFATLIADTTFPPLRLVVTEGAKLNEVLESTLCKGFGLAYRAGPDGKIVPIDLRLPSTAPSVPTITRADLIAGKHPGWSPDREGSVTRVEITHYLDDPVDAGAAKASEDEYPDIPAGRVTSRTALYIPVDLQAEADLGEKAYEIDAKGYRSGRGEITEMQDRLTWLRRHLDRVSAQVRGPFGYGPVTIPLVCRRTSNTDGCYPGHLRYVDVDELPNPAANRRGGARLARCLERYEEGVAVTLTFLDMGPGTVAVVPSIATPTQNAQQPAAAVDLAVSTNASQEPVEVDIALTTTAVGTRPAATSSAWTPALRAYFSATYTIGALPPNVRVWVRARTTALEGAQWKLPSAWVFPASTGYVDTGTVPAFDSFSLALDDAGAGTVAFVGNAAALGARIYYATARNGAAMPALSNTFDVAASDLGAAIPIVTPLGHTLWVEGEPWTGWSGSAATGSRGPRVQKSVERPEDNRTPPLILTDSTEAAGVGTLYWLEQERGIGVTSRAVTTQTGNETPVGPSAPLRGPGDTSVVYARVLVAGEYEHDVSLHSSRLSTIRPALTLETGEVLPIDYPPFDSDSTPNLLLCDVVGQTVKVLADPGDTKSLKAHRTDLASGDPGYWEQAVDGLSYTFSVPIGASEVWPVQVCAYGAPVVAVGVGTAMDCRDVIVYGSGYTPGSEPTWDEDTSVVAPDDLTVTAFPELNATSAPAGYYAKVWMRSRGFSPNTSFWNDFSDVTGDLSPALTAPPTTLTQYDLDLDAPQRDDSGGRVAQFEFRLEILNASDVVVATLTRSMSYPYL